MGAGPPRRSAPRGTRRPSSSRRARRSHLALLPHRLLVPQPDVIAVGILEVRAVAPERLLRRMDKLHPGGHQLLVLGLDVADLERQNAAWPPRSARRLGEEQREAELVLHGRGAPLWNLELELEPERLDVPVARLLAVGHRDRQVVELDHASSVGPPSGTGSATTTTEYAIGGPPVTERGKLGRGRPWGSRHRRSA